MTLSCTCGPHPVVNVDLDSLTNSGSSSDVQDACRSHGCFHLRISVPHDDPSPLHNLQGDLCSNTESLFDEDMVRCANLNPDGGLVDTSYVAASSRRSATYRGRTSESGAAQQPEPKQSWELRRCHAVAGSDVADDSRIVGERLGRAEKWTDGLHRAAEIVVQMLGVDKDTILQNGTCECSDKASCENKCCMDLMRVFRYDALPSDQSRTSRPGSSPHSDWGSLTLVWQDTSGGLQTYCHECDKWSDVAASLDADTSKKMINLFVHIGDFLSLATGGEYPSPRHRVLCPLQKEGGPYKESRCSLVYFAYPPLGLSLEEAEKKLSQSTNLKKRGVSLCYDRYSLLQNQSTQPSDKSAHKDVYDHIRTLPFEEAIKEKWAQVQRK